MSTPLPSLHARTRLPRGCCRCLSTIILKRWHSVTCARFPGVIWWRRTQCCAQRPWGRERSREREENTTTPCWESDCLMGTCCKVRTFLKNSFQSRKMSEDGRGKWLVMCDSRYLLCMGSTACALWVRPGVAGGWLAAFWAHCPRWSETTGVWGRGSRRV